MKVIGVLLGAGISNKGRLTREAKKRADKALTTFKKKKLDKLVLSGGFVNHNFPKISEAMLFEKYLISKGIKKSKLIREEKSLETIGNAVFSKKVILRKIKNYKANEIIVITGNRHLKRALFVFKHIFGGKYKVTGTKRKISFSLRKILHEKRSFILDKIFLTQIKVGDHKKAEKMLKKEISLYF